MSGLLNIEVVRVPRRHVLEAHAHLQQVGRQGLEGFALWAGRQDEATFHVEHTIIPAQTGFWLPDGLCVMVDANELHRINVWLYQHTMTLIAQLHSHPTEAYHSTTDNTFPIATTTGCLSLVLPHFARQPFSLVQCAVYRLHPTRGWIELDADQVQRLIRLEES
jgi:hypothetical protein